VLDERNRVLLFRFRDPGKDHDHHATPGGGLEPGESFEDAAVRELAEEVFLRDVALGPVLWDRTTELDFLGRRTRAEERYFLLRVDSANVAPYVGHLAHENVVGRAWWTLDDLASTGEQVWPSRLAALVRDVIERGAPPEPIAIGP
jgi:ADP-ribose pyrophosphatase YjhB (NUDIX family)